MLRKTSLVVGSIVLAILGFSPMLLSIVRKNNSHVDIKLTPKYYEQSEESLFILENQKE
ncbi:MULTISPECIES: hypothetical protein [Enterococcus]|uniref:Uncharacterized protein n=1 Tax=Enterococcus mundtii TaxID=53346 RepID=A0A848MW83_ENTMU|nr:MULTISPECIES: hypothetical protein [Enterococcus]EOH63772.1 hypothetical protein UAC_01036 [Enterococcus mundtii ATCC 882]EOU13247.1 hypothetical protein I587_01797 [Enterococcus mundtii ATCC 882]MBE9909712.1 hypothetical protein [Enterococcus mundtii]MCA6772952.1 hypothetical protein [Enterococcus mundtii]NMP57003.1 hypothetical protein [Enterococcus mundtii]